MSWGIIAFAFLIFIETFRSEISDYIKACTEKKRNQTKRFEVLDKVLEEWQKDKEAAKCGDETRQSPHG